jgi:hypothetical protein
MPQDVRDGQPDCRISKKALWISFRIAWMVLPLGSSSRSEMSTSGATSPDGTLGTGLALRQGRKLFDARRLGGRSAPERSFTSGDVQRRDTVARRDCSVAVYELWYKNAILYCLAVEKYMDANGDGTGDFEGLHRRLEYLAGLGVTCLWLQPFYPSPNRDNGYDISDFYGVHPKYGSPGDFVEFMNHAKALGLRVIVDLVVNHTSDAHPWFQSARSDPRSPFRDWYVWADDRPEDYDKGRSFRAHRKPRGRSTAPRGCGTFTDSTTTSPI